MPDISQERTADLQLFEMTPCISEEHRDIIISLLLKIARRHQELTRDFVSEEPRFFHPLELVRGKLYQELAWIAAIAERRRGQIYSEEERLRFREILQHIFHVLFLGLHPDLNPNIYLFPEGLDGFVTTPLGRMINQARLRMLRKEDLLSVKELMERLKIVRSIAYHLVHEGKLHPLKDGKHWYFDIWEVDLYQAHSNQQNEES
jgi:hypothetical protein